MDNSRSLTLCVVPGDGIGQEVIPAAVLVLRSVLPGLEITEAEAGWNVFQTMGTALPPATLNAVNEAGALLFGATSSPSYPVEGYQSPILTLRRTLNAFANLRPAKKWLDGGSMDLLVIRENTEGLYSGQEDTNTLPDGTLSAVTYRMITQTATARVARTAFEVAASIHRHLTIVHKANVVKQGDGLWRRTCLQVAADFPDVHVDEILVDTAAHNLVRNPGKYHIMLCPNMYGDILSDLAAGLADGLGMAPSLSVGSEHAIAEPVHGSAPDIAGKGVANPIAAILSGAMLCRYWWQLPQTAEIIETAVVHALSQGYRTPDIGRPGEKIVGTEEMAAAIVAALPG